MNLEKQHILENTLRKVAKKYNFEIVSLNLKTNQNPTIIRITIKKINGDDLKYGKVNVLNPFFIAKSNFVSL